MLISQCILETGSRTPGALKDAAGFLTDLSGGIVKSISENDLDNFIPRLFRGDLDSALKELSKGVAAVVFGSTPNKNFPWDHYLLVEAIVPAPGQKFSQRPIHRGPAFAQIIV